MMIPYVEVIGKYTLKPFALVEPSDCWFELSYYEKGEFEVYAPANKNNLDALKNGNYVKIPNKPYLWIIKSVQYTYNPSGARMIDAKGYEAKWIIGQRIIPAPFQLPTNLADAIYQLTYKNLGLGALSYRKIVGFKPIVPSFNITIQETQATRQNLWDFIADLLKANKCGSYTTFENGEIVYRAILGQDKTDNVIFSQSMDNLITSNYYEDSSEKKTFCRIVSTFTEKKTIIESGVEKEIDVDVEYPQDYDAGGTNIDRSEMVVESNISTKLYDEDGNPVLDDEGKQVDISPSSEQYKSWQRQEGKNKLAEHIIKKEFNGEIDLKFSKYEFEKDFFIGDLVMVRDEYFGYESPTRILKYTFKQDAKGYGEECEYGNE